MRGLVEGYPALQLLFPDVAPRAHIVRGDGDVELCHVSLFLCRAMVGGEGERSVFWMPFVKGNGLRCDEWEGLVVGEALEYSRITYPEISDGTYQRCDYQICPFPFPFLRPIIGFVRWLAVHDPDGRRGWEIMYRVRSTEYVPGVGTLRYAR